MMNYQAVVKPVQLVLYFLIASQGAFYLVGFYKVLSAMPSRDFILLRKTADPVMAPKLKVLYLLTLVMSIVAILVNFRSWSSVSLVLFTAATLCLLADILIALTVSEPLNKVITALQEPFKGAAAIQRKWLEQIYIRAFLSAGGFLMLLFTYVKRS
jgi:uncharacterized membrane protein